MGCSIKYQRLRYTAPPGPSRDPLRRTLTASPRIFTPRARTRSGPSTGGAERTPHAVHTFFPVQSPLLGLMQPTVKSNQRDVPDS